VQAKKSTGKKWVYLFEEVKAAEKYAGDWEGVRSLLGGKGSGLADMTRANVPVPPGFTVTTEACNEFRKSGEFPKGQRDQQVAAMKVVEKQTGRKFGDPSNPLLVSCRSGAKFSMPGMMNTVLNIGLNDEVVEGMSDSTQNPRFVWDLYRRLIEMFGTTVFNLDDEVFEHPMADYKAGKGYKVDTEMTAEDWRRWSPLSRKFSRNTSVLTSRRMCTSNSSWQPKPCSNHGWGNAPLITAADKHSG
jgi:pyruvate, orthophosphate dikinase